MILKVILSTKNTVLKNVVMKSCGLLRGQERNFYGYLINIFNRPSASRIEEVGPDRACAEWLLRNGAAIRWKGTDEFISDYNCLPLTEEAALAGPFYIEDVDATDAAIASQGFRHFDGCNYVRKVKLIRNYYMSDAALQYLKFLHKSLNELEIRSCSDITESGLRSLFPLSNLKTLNLEDLQGVKDKEKITSELKAAIPGCKVSYP